MNDQAYSLPTALACARGALDQIQHVIEALEVAIIWRDDPMAAVAGTAPRPWGGPIPDEHDPEHYWFAYRAGRELTFKGVSHFARKVLDEGHKPCQLAAFLRTRETAHGLLSKGYALMSTQDN